MILNLILTSGHENVPWWQSAAPIISGGITGLSAIIVGFVFTRSHNHIQRQLDITKQCIDHYRTITRDNREIDEKNAIPFLGLISQQMVYMKHGYILELIAKEWLNTMIDYMPLIRAGSRELINEKKIKMLFDENSQANKSSPVLKVEIAVHLIPKPKLMPRRYTPYIIENVHLLVSFPRIYKIFTISEKFFKQIELQEAAFIDLIYSENLNDLENRNKMRNNLVKYLWKNIKNCPI